MFTTYKNHISQKSITFTWVLGLGNTEALVVASKEIGLEVNAEKTEYMNMSHD